MNFMMLYRSECTAAAVAAAAARLRYIPGTFRLILFVVFLHRNPVPYGGSMDEKYENMVQKHARWFSDGQIDNQKNIQLSLSSHLPLSNEMTFVLVFSM